MTTPMDQGNDGGRSDGTGAGAQMMRQFVPASPYVGLLGMRLDEVGSGAATLSLPFRAPLATIGSVVHGGAIASLIDTAAMVAAWSEAPVPETPRGSTVGMTVSYLAPASGEDLAAQARVLRRGRGLVYVDVEVRGATSGLLAKGLVTYKLG